MVAKKSQVTTHVQLEAKARAKAVELLQARLADALDLASMAKHAHWNVKGPNFIALHKMFDELHDDVEEYVDLLAERLVVLGGVASGTTRQVAKSTTLEEYPADLTAGRDHVAALAKACGALGGKVRTAIDTAGQFGDAATQDLFTEIVRGLDQWTWFLEAHLQAEA